MQRILITGGYGFVGTALLSVLASRKDIQITILDNLMTQVGNFLPLTPKGATFIKGDIRDRVLVNALVKKHDTIVHLAGIVGYPACNLNPQLTGDINYNGTCRIIEALTPKQRIIFTSSTSVYGSQQDTVNEESRVRPLTSYGEYKHLGELALQRSNRQHIIFRPATAFGVSARIRLDLLPNTLAYLALTKPEIDIYEPSVIRPFIHVIDFARALAWAIDDHLPWNEVYNIGNPDLTMTKEKLAQRFASKTGSRLIIREGTDPDQRNYDVSFDKFLGSGFQCLPDTINLGFEQIQDALITIKENPGLYDTKNQVLSYLRKSGEYAVHTKE